MDNGVLSHIRRGSSEIGSPLACPPDGIALDHASLAKRLPKQ